MQLYDYFRSSAAYRVRIALNLKGLAYEHVPVSLLKGEHRQADYLALNAQGAVPALRLADGTVLTQSLAICEYLEETHPEPSLLPADTLQRARVRALANAVACDIHPLNNLRVLNYLVQELNVDEASKIELVPSLDRPRPERYRAAARPIIAYRHVLSWGRADTRRCVPDSAVVQRQTVRVCSARVSDRIARRSRMHRVTGFRGCASESATRRDGLKDGAQ